MRLPCCEAFGLVLIGWRVGRCWACSSRLCQSFRNRSQDSPTFYHISPHYYILYNVHKEHPQTFPISHQNTHFWKIHCTRPMLIILYLPKIAVIIIMNIRITKVSRMNVNEPNKEFISFFTEFIFVIVFSGRITFIDRKNTNVKLLKLNCYKYPAITMTKSAIFHGSCRYACCLKINPFKKNYHMQRFLKTFILCKLKEKLNLIQNMISQYLLEVL